MPKSLLYLVPYLLVSTTCSAFLRTLPIVIQEPTIRIAKCPSLGVVPDFTSIPTEQIVMAAAAMPDLNSEVKAEVITDVSHVALDFSVFITPSKSLYLSFAVVGRILLLYMDFYVPGHNVPPEELVIQLFLLGTNLKDLVGASVGNQNTEI